MGYLYCMKSGDYVKIGFSINPKKRLIEVRCGDWTLCPIGMDRRAITLECQVVGKKAQEREFHRRFRNERIADTSEWYPAGGEAHAAFRVLLSLQL